MAPDARTFAKVIKDAHNDTTSSKRLHEILEILSHNQAWKGLTPERCCAVLQELGPTFVKLGQIASSRSDLLPQEYCDAFKQLRSNCDPMTFEEVEECLNASYDGDYKTVFRRVNKGPLGSASVAQVHKGVLRHGSQTVAIKVQRPGIKQKMTEDVQVLRRANDLLELTSADNGDFDVSSFVDELERSVHDEIDFRIEAANLAEFHKNEENSEGITSPVVYPDVSSETVLVMEYIEGAEVNDIDNVEAQGADPVDIGNRIVNDYMVQMLKNGLFHADPHPGNIIVRKEDVVWIDLGMVGRLNPKERSMLRDIFKDVAQNDAQGLKGTLLVWGRTTGEINHPELLRNIDSLLARYATSDIEDLDISSGLQDLMDLLKSNHIKMPACFTMLARGLITLEGTVEAISPQISLMGVLTNYLKKTALDDFDPKKEIQSVMVSLRNLSQKAINIPTQFSDLLDMLEKGEARVNIGLRGIDEPIQKVSRSMDRLTLGMITAGLFVGSSLLCTTTMEPRFLGVPIIGFFGYLGALILSVYIVVKGRK